MASVGSAGDDPSRIEPPGSNQNESADELWATYAEQIHDDPTAIYLTGINEDISKLLERAPQDVERLVPLLIQYRRKTQVEPFNSLRKDVLKTIRRLFLGILLLAGLFVAGFLLARNGSVLIESTDIVRHLRTTNSVSTAGATAFGTIVFWAIRRHHRTSPRTKTWSRIARKRTNNTDNNTKIGNGHAA